MNGFLNVLKSPGPTSNDIVQIIRKTINMKKVGHTGTLDPGAAGILPICIGKATRLSEYVMNSSKKYRCELTFGAETDTCDSYGQIINVSNNYPSYHQVEEALELFTGELNQIPPKYSAIKINGKKLYQLAREGKSIDIKSRKVNILEINIVSCIEPNKYVIDITCSKGTYIRSICRDIGAHLRCYAYMSMLIRTDSCGFTLSNSSTIDEIETHMLNGTIKKILLPMDKAVTELECVYIKDSQRKKAVNGVQLNSTEFTSTLSDRNTIREVKVFTLNDKEFIGIGLLRYIDSGLYLKMKKVLTEV